MSSTTTARKSDGRVVTTYEFPVRPEKQSFKQFCYNNSNGEILGRTTKAWGQLILFYLAFYVVLAALFAICMQALLATMNHEYPKWQLDASLIGTNPGLGYRPMPADVDEGAMIHYTAANKTDVKSWVGRINEFLEPYRDQSILPGGGKNQVICDFQHPAAAGNVCAFDVTKLGPCNAEEGYSYNKSAPCIFIKLNRIYGWVPEFYDDITDLPEDMPTDLSDHIKSLPVEDRKQVWVSCNGLAPADVETIGPIEYFPHRGLPSFYYPYTNLPGYLSPLVAVHFARPAVKRSINVECRVWAKNVVYRGGQKDRQGSVNFILLID